MTLERRPYPLGADSPSGELDGEGTVQVDALVVDGESRIIAEMLGSMGYRCRAVADCHEGLYAIAESAPELIVVGLGAGGMACYQFLQLVRKYPTTGSVPVITLVPERPERAELARLRDLEVNEFLRRPFTMRLLRDAVTRAHPDGPARAGAILGTSSSFELPPVHEPEPVQDVSMEHPLPPDEIETAEFAPPPILRPAAVVTATVNVGTEEGRAVEMEGLEGQLLSLRTRRYRLRKGDEVRVEANRQEGDLSDQVRLLGCVTESRWRLGGGRATLQVTAAIPIDGAETLGRWLSGS